MSISGLFALRCPPPIPCLLLCFRSPAGIEQPFPVPGCSPIRWSVPYAVLLTRKHLDLPSSRATPVSTCPGLRPRWYPQHSPFRAKDCCLPHTARRRRSSRIAGFILMTTTIHFSGLYTEPEPLFRPASYSGYPVCTWISLLSWWLTFTQVGLSLTG